MKAPLEGLRPALPGEALHARAARTLREAILAGLLPEGTRLPGHRALAARLGVSRNTLVDALAQLEAEGYVRASARSGTRVAMPGPVHAAPTDPPLPLSAWATRALAGRVPDAGGGYAVDFRPGQPVPDLYPAGAWAEALARQARQATSSLPELEAELGPLETRRALAAYLNAERGARVTPDMVMLTGGTQASLDALARVFLEEGRVAATEDPTYPGARAALGATGATLCPVPVDAGGLNPAALPEQATLLYLTPGAQYPTTVALPAARQGEVVAWARRAGAFILEDDYAADLHHGARPPAALQGLAPERVILLGTFSKSLAPVTRSGYLVAPESVIRVLAGTRPLTDRAPATLDALALADVLASGAYARHLRRARQAIRHRHEVLLSALAAGLPEWQVTPARAGLHVHVTLPAGLSEEEAVAVAARAGVALTPAAPLARLPRPPAVLLAFAHLSPERLREGVARLSRAFARTLT
ncbi:PLP-dependent aminotransferase family protein [Deinococcus metallilatus]|uniref:GntR family transcriptional regulator/MocR family aminotransferase n=1 Tax=Deinococcus metallilatus TaxID=1211322 RepID=A0AAJ5F1B9_9DEIO|nr:PLP-dependent aminotransferase family protein [Deinococcus metallilatus]MBB5296479.1 GntR family transcriptional regulator/MocR family aminotransferase [Deinococcus metallilatus]QBY08488.1 PLP-dependent aminotransferase family protein [Deinococcus metallilatus]RXJ11287.1 PLP-dependent aminotransferase family protein [Deinococcus metallilatus]TLK24778.1 PLP-dependent aminotransferase family protein [Deinococcus metallilatus]GMA17396.1 GntR family transcriptional regulator [Deinococcus metall